MEQDIFIGCASENAPKCNFINEVISLERLLNRCKRKIMVCKTTSSTGNDGDKNLLRDDQITKLSLLETRLLKFRGHLEHNDFVSTAMSEQFNELAQTIRKAMSEQ